VDNPPYVAVDIPPPDAVDIPPPDAVDIPPPDAVDIPPPDAVESPPPDAVLRFLGHVFIPVGIGLDILAPSSRRTTAPKGSPEVSAHSQARVTRRWISPHEGIRARYETPVSGTDWYF
jgi:hypothetical protein